MKRIFNYVAFTLLIGAIFTSCNSDPTLQRYFVDSQESANFISQDVPLSMVKIDDSQFTEDQKEAYNSVKRLNFLGYRANESNVEELEAEVAIVKEILSDAKYQDLMEFSDKGNKIVVKYLGDDDEADEVIIFGSAKELGFGVVRVLGDDMSPDKMVTLVSALKDANVDESNVQDIMNFFK